MRLLTTHVAVRHTCTRIIVCTNPYTLYSGSMDRDARGLGWGRRKSIKTTLG